MLTPGKQAFARARGLEPAVVTARGGQHGITHRSTEAHLQYWTGLDIPVEIHAQRLLNAYHGWMAVDKNGLPRLSDLITSDATEADNDMLLFLKVDDDYVVVDQGVDHVRHIGRDLRGRLLSEFDMPASPVLKQLYDDCLARSEPIYSRLISDFTSDSVYWEGLFLPLKADDSGKTLFVMNYNTPIDNKTDILQMILDRSPIGMIAAVPLSTNKNNTHDGRIISINARAKDILKCDENGTGVRYIRDLAPWFRNVSGWTPVNMTTEGTRTCFRYCDRSNRQYSVTMEALKRFILFSIAECCDANAAPAVKAGSATHHASV